MKKSNETEAIYPIAELREAKRLGIKHISQALDVPYPTVLDWAARKSRPPRWAERMVLREMGKLIAEDGEFVTRPRKK